MSTVSSASSAAATSTSSTKSSGSSLGKDDFLKLLVTQMQHQDPLNPTDDTQSIAQLAQFSALEEMQNVSNSTQTSQAVNMIGDSVKWDDGTGTSMSGTVSSISIKDSTTQLTVALDSATIALLDDSKIVGDTISWTDTSKTSHTGVVKNVGNDSTGVAQITVTETDSKGNAKDSLINASNATNIQVYNTIALGKVTNIAKGG